MTRFPLITIALFAGSAMLCAQEQQPGGWRRVGDPPPAPPESAAPPQAGWQDPAQPVERAPVDAYGNPQQRNDRPPSAARGEGAPPPYGLPADLTIKPGTF